MRRQWFIEVTRQNVTLIIWKRFGSTSVPLQDPMFFSYSLGTILSAFIFFSPFFSRRNSLRGIFLRDGLPSYALLLPFLCSILETARVIFVSFIFSVFHNQCSLSLPLIPFTFWLYQHTRLPEFWSVKLSREYCLSGAFHKREETCSWIANSIPSRCMPHSAH